MRLLFRLLARLPLAANHAVGALAGRLAFRLAPRYRRRILENVARSGVARDSNDVGRIAQASAMEIGKGVTELAWALFRPDDTAARVHDRIGWDCVERLRREGRPILFVTPHLGSFDVAGRYLWKHLPILAMYRPHKVQWIDDMLREGRNRGAAADGTNVAPATLAGVRRVLKHLRAGGCTVLLPDQVPGVGEGEWVEFFGRPAYTMTLTGRLQQATGAAIVSCHARRLPGGQGYVLHLHEMTPALPLERMAAARAVNEEVERLIRDCPEQYLWGYNRFKRPAGAPPPPDRGTVA